MTGDPSSENPQRSKWAHFLIDLLQGADRPHHAQAASLLRLFATASNRDQLEAVLVDRERDPWVRTYVLRAIAHRRVPVSSAGFRRLVAEFAGVLASGEARKMSGVRRLAEVDTLPTLVEVGTLAGEQPAVVRLLQSLDGEVARELLKWDRIGSSSLGARLREVTYRRVVELGALDDTLAWETLSFAESRRRVFDSSREARLDKLDRALGAMAPDVVHAVFADYPAARAAAVEGLALPIAFLLSRHPADELRRSALRCIRERRPGGVGVWKLVRLISALPNGAMELEALLHDEALPHEIRSACAAARLTLQPTVDFNMLPQSVLANALRFLRPDSAHRALLNWAIESENTAFQYAGLTGLLTLDGALDPRVLDRFHTSDEELLRLTALGAFAAAGDLGASSQLHDAARRAPQVVLRARALRSLRSGRPACREYHELCVEALEHDHELFDGYYAPATSEAALCLSRSDHLSEEPALRALVHAGLDLSNDEDRWAIESSIESWLDGTDAEAGVNPVWFWMYLWPAHRNHPPRPAGR